jgi:hypothetical protein
MFTANYSPLPGGEGGPLPALLSVRQPTDGPGEGRLAQLANRSTPAAQIPTRLLTHIAEPDPRAADLSVAWTISGLTTSREMAWSLGITASPGT